MRSLSLLWIARLRRWSRLSLTSVVGHRGLCCRPAINGKIAVVFRRTIFLSCCAGPLSHVVVGEGQNKLVFRLFWVAFVAAQRKRVIIFDCAHALFTYVFRTKNIICLKFPDERVADC